MRNKQTAVRTVEDLADTGFVPEATPELRQAANQYAVAITPAMLELIDPNDPNDPIATQFVPSAQELSVHPDELADPISDHPFSPMKGLVHRYPDRVLLKLLLACPVHCRFCFRKEQLDDPNGTMTEEELTAALGYIRARPEIWEVILTGGDPLMLSAKTLGDIVTHLNAIPHVKVIRIHTRIPVTDPAKVTQALAKALKGRAPVYVLLHCNHPRELTEVARAACARLIDAGIPMLSQSVLLRGVNDDAKTLETLMRTFVECRIKPHYLHHADLARGTNHFRVPLEKGRELARGLRGHLSGLGQPTYMLDIPGGHGKVPVGPNYLTETGHGWGVEDYRGNTYVYRDNEDCA